MNKCAAAGVLRAGFFFHEKKTYNRLFPVAGAPRSVYTFFHVKNATFFKVRNEKEK